VSAAVQFASVDVLEGTVTMPRVGAWTAPLTLDAPETFSLSKLEAPALLASGDGSFSLLGTAIRSSVVDGALKVLVVAGNGGLHKPVAARAYRQSPAKIIISSLLAEVGEVLSPTSAPLSDPLDWSGEATVADRALSAIVDHLGLSWRVLPDGTVWVGAETWLPFVDETAAELERDAAVGLVRLAVEVPRALPGRMWDGQQVHTVVHTIGASLQTALYLESDRLREAFKKIVEKVSPSSNYDRPYVARVAAQNLDGTLELVLEDATMPSLSKVPIRYPLPGVTAKVAPRATVLVLFDGGKPTAPKACLFDSGSLLEVTVTAPSIVLGGTLAVPAARAPETLAAIAAIQTTLGAIATAAAALDVGLGTPPAVIAFAQALKGLGTTLNAALGTPIAKLPSTTTRVL
jgi:hypothetical protein